MQGDIVDVSRVMAPLVAREVAGDVSLCWAFGSGQSHVEDMRSESCADVVNNGFSSGLSESNSIAEVAGWTGGVGGEGAPSENGLEEAFAVAGWIGAVGGE